MATQSILTGPHSELVNKVTRAELSDIIVKLRAKAEKYKDRDLATMANRLIAVHNMGLPEVGHLTLVRCLDDWMVQEGFDSLSDVSRIMGWNRATLAGFKGDKEMVRHVVVHDRIYKRYEKAGG